MVLSCRNGYECLGKTSDSEFSSARSSLEIDVRQRVVHLLTFLQAA